MWSGSAQIVLQNSLLRCQHAIIESERRHLESEIARFGSSLNQYCASGVSKMVLQHNRRMSGHYAVTSSGSDRHTSLQKNRRAVPGKTAYSDERFPPLAIERRGSHQAG